jgi:hypothetical protein
MMTPPSMLNLSNYNKDGSPEAPNFTWVPWGRKKHYRYKGGVDGIYLAFDYICLIDFFITLLAPPSPLPHKKLRVAVFGYACYQS